MTNYNSGTYDLGSRGFPGKTFDATVNPSQTVTFNLVGILDVYNITGLAGSDTTLKQDSSDATQLNLIADGGEIQLGNGFDGLKVDSALVEQGGSLLIDNRLIGNLQGAISFGPGGGSVIVGAQGVTGLVAKPVFQDFTSPLDTIDNRGFTLSSFRGYTITGDAGGTQVVQVAGAAPFTFTVSDAGLVDGNYSFAIGGPLTFTADADGGLLVAPTCFLRGTRIATPAGEIAIEELRPGALVATRTAAGIGFREVIWIGSRRVSLGATAEPDSYPVRICAGAIAEGLPARDLLVTGEHGLHLDGRLIPARMLVNGRSITVETGLPRFQYFHLELAEHAILLAEGLETESYLDTGNRGNFTNVGVPSLRPDFTQSRDWDALRAAPLATERATVEPIWRRLSARAGTLRLGAPPTPPVLISDPDLCLVTGNGRVIPPTQTDGRRVGFFVPAGSSTLRLRSRSARPAETVGPFLDDRRRLGVLIGRIGLGDGGAIDLTAALDAPVLDGWHAREAGAPGRWTDGNATLPLPSTDRAQFVSLEVLAAGPYLAAGVALAA